MARGDKFTGRQPWPAGIYAVSNGTFQGHQKVKFILPTPHGEETVTIGDYIIEVGEGEYQRMSSTAVEMTVLSSLKPLLKSAYAIPPGGYSDQAIRATQPNADKS